MLATVIPGRVVTEGTESPELTFTGPSRAPVTATATMRRTTTAVTHVLDSSEWAEPVTLTLAVATADDRLESPADATFELSLKAPQWSTRMAGQWEAQVARQLEHAFASDDQVNPTTDPHSGGQPSPDIDEHGPVEVLTAAHGGRLPARSWRHRRRVIGWAVGLVAATLVAALVGRRYRAAPAVHRR